MKKNLVIYGANCADSFGAAWAAKHALGDYDTDYISAFQDASPPNVHDRDVYLLDVSYKRAVVESMVEDANAVYVLDHDSATIEDLMPLMVDRVIEGVLDNDRSGSVLAWEFFNPGEDIPELLQHLQDRALGQWKLPQTREIVATVDSYDHEFPDWDNLMETNTPRLAEIGSHLLRKFDKDVAEIIEKSAHYLTIAGVVVPAVNVPPIYATACGDILKKEGHFAACYHYHADHVKFSLRSKLDGAHVWHVAGLFGGSGTDQVANFEIRKDEMHKLGEDRWAIEN